MYCVVSVTMSTQIYYIERTFFFRREFLEIGRDRLSELCNITDKNYKENNFVDDPEVPPLE